MVISRFVPRGTAREWIEDFAALAGAAMFVLGVGGLAVMFGAGA